MNITLLTSTQPRHLKFAKTICEALDVSLIVFEEKESSSFLNEEQNFFNDIKDWTPECDTLKVKKKKINEDKVANLLRDKDPDYVLVFGTSLLRDNIYKIPKYGSINIHTGIVDYFRGVDSVFWSIYNNEPRGIGATIHYINDGIDTGPIIEYARPKLAADDNINTVFFKVCLASFIKLKDVLLKNNDARLISKKAQSKGKLYQNKDKRVLSECVAHSNFPQTLKEYISLYTKGLLQC
tara:strand:- start:2986 stop:3699 length:714 start_codon:yes stop_codon:yes gene_type:complete